MINLSINYFKVFKKDFFECLVLKKDWYDFLKNDSSVEKFYKKYTRLIVGEAYGRKRGVFSINLELKQILPGLLLLLDYISWLLGNTNM